jgi:hypothetical protein
MISGFDHVMSHFLLETGSVFSFAYESPIALIFSSVLVEKACYTSADCGVRIRSKILSSYPESYDPNTQVWKSLTSIGRDT